VEPPRNPHRGRGRGFEPPHTHNIYIYIYIYIYTYICIEKSMHAAYVARYIRKSLRT